MQFHAKIMLLVFDDAFKNTSVIQREQTVLVYFRLDLNKGGSLQTQSAAVSL